jgi:hypothetical protein
MRPRVSVERVISGLYPMSLSDCTSVIAFDRIVNAPTCTASGMARESTAGWASAATDAIGANDVVDAAADEAVTVSFDEAAGGGSGAATAPIAVGSKVADDSAVARPVSIGAVFPASSDPETDLLEVGSTMRAEAATAGSSGALCASGLAGFVAETRVAICAAFP